MKALTVAVAIPLVVTVAGSFHMQGRINHTYLRYTFEFDADSGIAKLFVEVTDGTRLKLTLKKGSDVLEQRVVRGPGPVDVTGPGTFTMVVEHDSGDGQWSCRALGNTGVRVHRVTGFAGPGCTPRFSFLSTDEDTRWIFTYPSEEVFYVRRIENGRVVEEQDLYDDREVQLIGERIHTLEVAAPEASGEFVAVRR